MEKILVPTDFSLQAENALQAAIIIAKNTNEHIDLVHVIEVPIAPLIATSGDSGSPSAGNRDLVTNAKNKLEKLIEKHAHPSIKINPVVVTNHEKGETSPNKFFSDYKGINLIVMGSKGAGGTKEIFIGSNTEYVVKHASVPVFVVKEKPVQSNQTAIILPVSFEKIPSRLVKAIHKHTASMNADLHLLYVNTALDFQSDNQIRKLYKEFIASHDFDKHTFAVNNAFSEEKGIFDYASLITADLIIMPTHGRTGLADFLSTSVTTDVVNHSHISVLTFNINNY